MYHDRTYRLLGIEPTQDASAAEKLVNIQRRLGIVFPPAVTEWYGRRNATSLLRQHSNDDPPIEISNFQTCIWQSRLLLPIRHENQGVCSWALELDGSDDPPVLVDVDTDGAQWMPCAQTFSDYVYAGTWDYSLIFNQPAVVSAQNQPLSSGTLSRLQIVFQPAVSTRGWPGSIQYRFANFQAAILIWSAADQADWFAAAPTARDLRELLRSISSLDDVGGKFYDCSPEGRDALESARSGIS